MTTTYLWTPPPVRSLPVRGKTERLPINRIFCVGRNYHAHAVEMGRPVDKATMKPFYFTKSPSTLVESGATVPYPAGTGNYHYEMELVVAIGTPAFRVTAGAAEACVFGYACGLDSRITEHKSLRVKDTETLRLPVVARFHDQVTAPIPKVRLARQTGQRQQVATLLPVVE